jgi:predicted type IV restriction endonuclease
LEDLEKTNQKLLAKLQKTEIETKEREHKLKTLHADELKYITEMNEHENNLFKSRIKELEGIISHRRDQSPLVSQMSSSFLCERTPPGSHLNSRHAFNPEFSR